MRLTFDRPVSVAGFDGTQVVLDDDDSTGFRFNGTGGATLFAPAVVQVALNSTGAAQQSGVHLTASAATGIVAVDDGGAWAGASGLALPYP